MIIRQFCARHGRTVLAQSSRTCRRTYATSISDDYPALQTLGQDAEAVSDILGATGSTTSTSATTLIEKMLDTQQESIDSLRAAVDAHSAARVAGGGGLQPTPAGSTADIPFSSLQAVLRRRRQFRKRSRQGTQLSQTYDPATILKHPPKAEELTLPMLLANQTHLGHATSLWNPSNSGYIFGVRDGIHIISLDITYAYLKRAAKVVREVARRGGIILFMGSREGMEDVVVNSANLAGGYHNAHRWVPGTLTNGQQILGDCGVKVVDARDQELPRYKDMLSGGFHQVVRPDLVVCFNPIENEVCLHECGIFNVPTIGVIDTDANPTWVTYPIPANDDSFRSIGLIGGVLGNAGREGQRLRLAEAEQGKTTYDTSALEEKLQLLEEIAAMEVQAEDLSTDKDLD